MLELIGNILKWTCILAFWAALLIIVLIFWGDGPDWFSGLSFAAGLGVMYFIHQNDRSKLDTWHENRYAALESQHADERQELVRMVSRKEDRVSDLTIEVEYLKSRIEELTQ